MTGTTEKNHSATDSAVLPLTGVTVVSLEQAVAAPLASRHLADLGARVIKSSGSGSGILPVTTMPPCTGWPRTSCGSTGARSRSVSTSRLPRVSRRSGRSSPAWMCSSRTSRPERPSDRAARARRGGAPPRSPGVDCGQHDRIRHRRAAEGTQGLRHARPGQTGLARSPAPRTRDERGDGGVPAFSTDPGYAVLGHG
ncbi:possible acyl-CoA transferase, N-terminal (plasmid) [Rhodococcus jostii RHA1]|uniref:Possible acyl-CoA transferase, N-terminal n=1 Tax=Rhodococcus jostii (strain RHA1) TaxID=101510 RepID=Q0RWL4_RHOJR|nr:hypothetical protein [Rhodococcus sp. DK17]ABH00322.1 possible acyl-CoA transferase, N-terminal [Rhodococcus jostii RHA1]